MRVQRTKEEIKEHYVIEKKLASRLRKASREERRSLYSLLYDEMFRRVPDHPQLTRKVSPELRKVTIENEVKMIENLLDRNTRFLEVGPGDCSLSIEVAKRVKQVYAVDVSETLTATTKTPDNFKLILSDGSSIPVPKNSINVAYSNQLMEHLHPDDAYEQIKNLFDALIPGGCYICMTPSRLSGPHDISRYFDDIATGFHLKEYTIKELSGLFWSVGFRQVFCYLGAKGWYVKIHPFLPIFLENLLEIIPTKQRKKLSNTTLVRALINIRLIGIK